MKRKITLAAVLIIAITGISVMAMGKKPVDTKGTPATVEKPASLENEAEQVAPQKKANHIYVKGELKQTKSGFFLFDGKETYGLKTQKDLGEMMGKIVMVRGELATGETGTVILVDKLNVIK